MTNLLHLNTVQTMLSIGLVFAFFLISFLPYEVLILTDLFLVRGLLLAGFILALQVSPIVGILALIVISMLFIERNKLKLHQVQTLMGQNTSNSEAIASITTPDTAPQQPSFTVPGIQKYNFMPENESGDNTFEPVAPSLNQKHPLPTETVDGSDKAIHQLFEWVNPNLAQDS